MPEYIPPQIEWVRKHVERYENSGGTEGIELPNSDLPCIIVTHTGAKTGGIRKIPLMRVKTGDSYVLVGSYGGAPKHPGWVLNLRANDSVKIRDETEVHEFHAREVSDDDERERLWAVAVEAYPPYADYKEKTSRKIPVFLAEPTG
jgi:deazaflavin-dependent oxidoreductase (nitroreductase family)